jgi:hypothetical protein
MNMGSLIMGMDTIGSKDQGRVEPRRTLLERGREQEDIFDARVIAFRGGGTQFKEHVHFLLQLFVLVVVCDEVEVREAPVLVFRNAP